MRRQLALFALCLVFLLGLAAPRALALQAADPRALVSSLVSQAIATIQDKQISEQQRETKFRSLLASGFDIPRISRFVLGRYWRTASDQERAKFGSLFEDWIVRTYSVRFSNYSGQTIDVTGVRPEGADGAVVLSRFNQTNGAPPANVDWHVRKETDGSYKIVDVSVENVSMALTERDEIASVADRNGGTIKGLNKFLAEKLSGNSATAAK
jgi:phospholipid transport system substrate-binding protein